MATASTAVLWRPSRCFEPATLVIDAFAPVVGLFGVVFIGCIVAGIVNVVIEIQVPDSMFFVESPGSERAKEVRGGKPLGRGFWFALNSTFQNCCIGDICPTLFFSDRRCRLRRPRPDGLGVQSFLHHYGGVWPERSQHRCATQ